MVTLALVLAKSRRHPLPPRSVMPTNMHTNMHKRASNGWFSPPQERTSSFERASATKDIKISIPAAHEQPFVWKTLTKPEAARFAQGRKKAMKMRKQEKVKRKDALVAVCWQLDKSEEGRVLTH